MSSSASNPYSVARSAERLFRGRQRELSDLRDGLRSPIRRSFAIIGGRRFGKTSLLKQLQRSLSHPPTESWESPIIPVYINLLGYAHTLSSPQDFFAAVKTLLSRQITLHWANASEDNCASVLHSKPGIPPYCVFGDWLIQKCCTVAPEATTPRIIVLLDEVESILHESWKDDLLSALRMLVYEDDAYSRVFGLVTAGSSEFYKEIEDKGSPLWQVLDSIYLLALSEEEARNLIQEPSNGQVPESVAEQVISLSGGHPFLIQYFMQNLWDKLPQVSIAELDALARSFTVSKEALLSSWAQALGPVGVDIYRALANHCGTWVSEQQIREQVRRPNIMASLKPLCYHGFAIPRDHDWTHFRCTGELFRTWFIKDLLPDAQMSGNTERRHQETQRQELDRRFNELTERIAALDTDLGVETDSERKLTLKERRERVIVEREEVTNRLREIERQLADVSTTPGT